MHLKSQHIKASNKTKQPSQKEGQRHWKSHRRVHPHQQKPSLLFGGNKIKIKIHLPEVKLAVSRREGKSKKYVRRRRRRRRRRRERRLNCLKVRMNNWVSGYEVNLFHTPRFTLGQTGLRMDCFSQRSNFNYPDGLSLPVVSSRRLRRGKEKRLLLSVLRTVLPCYPRILWLVAKYTHTTVQEAWKMIREERQSDRWEREVEGEGERDIKCQFISCDT